MGERKGVRQVSTSSYEISFQLNGVRCRERIRLPPSKANLNYLVNYRAEIHNAIERGTFDYAEFFPDSPRARSLSKSPGRAIPISEALDAWLDRVESELEKSTFRDYKRSVLFHLVPAFGHMTLVQITKSDVRSWASGLDCTKKRLSNLLTPLRQILSDAFDEDLIDKNPLHGWTPKRKGHQKPGADPFAPEELQRILDKADGQIHNLIQFWAWTGVRTSELNGLQWSDTDGQFVHISRAAVQGELKGPKTASGNRSIKLLAPAIEALYEQRRHTWFQGKYVFHNPRTDTPWQSNASFARTYWKPLLLRAKVRYRQPYQLRHTYASTMISSGENIHWVANQLGHRDITMILRTYGKWIPSVDPDAGKKAEALAKLRPK